MPRATITAYTASADGRRLFVLGMAKDEASPGIWEYDIPSAKLTNVVPYADYPSRYAQLETRSGATLTLPSGGRLNYDIFPPVHAYEHPHRKYPLIIGNTQFGVTMRGVHGRLWIPAMAACDAYVIVVNRVDWWQGLDRWSDNVRAVYNEATKTLPIDKGQVFLFGASAETTYMTPLITNSPALWKGVLFLNPTGLPDFSSAPPGLPRPRILISAGGLERGDARFKKYQDDALRWGVAVEYITHPGEGHHLVGNVSQVERTKAMVRFIFDD
jgi:hypothetical protein